MAEIIVPSGRTSSGLTLYFGDQMFVSSGGIADSTTVNELNANLYVSSGGTANSTTVNSGGRFTVYFSGTANNTTLNYGGLYVSNGTVNNTITNDGGLHISGGTANNIVLNSGGWLYLFSGGTANNTTVNDEGPYVSSRGLFVLYGGTANSNTINSGGSMNVEAGGTANSNTINSGGSMYVSSGGTATEILENGGYIYVDSSATATFRSNTLSGLFLSHAATVHSGTIADSTTVNAGGWLYLFSGGTATSTTVNSSGRFCIYNGGTATSTTVNSGSLLVISSGGTANKIKINYGSMYVGSGGTATNFTASDGTYFDLAVASDTLIQGVSNGTPFEIKDAFVSGYTIQLLGRLTVYSGGMATDTTVSGGWLYVSGGTVNSTTFNAGYLYVFSGTANNTTISNFGSMYVSSGGTANNTTIKIFGSMYVSSGGTVNDTEVRSGGWLIVSSGGTANSNTVNSGGYMYISSGGTATEILENGGDVSVDPNAKVTFRSNAFSGLIISNAGATVHSGTIADKTTLDGSRGYLCVYYGGMANNTTVNSGRLIVSSGGTANSNTVNSGGYLHVSSGGTANSTTVNADSWLDIYSSGMANSTTVNSGGGLGVYGTANSTTVNAGGGLIVGFDGKANSTTVNSNGELTVSFGGTLTGKMTFESGAIVSAYGGSILDFNLIEATVGKAALVNDLTIIQGAPDYTLTIDGSQSNGTYKLAGGAAGFDKTITVVDTEDELGTLEVGRTTTINGVDYTLSLADEVLSVTVEGATPPAPAYTAKGDIDGNGVSDVLFQYTGGDYQLGYWMNGTNEWRGQGLAKPAEWEVLGSYDMNNNGKADSVLVGNVEVGGVKGAYIGYYLDSVDKDSNWVNIGYLNNEENIAWKNKVGNLTGNSGMNSIVWYAPELYALGVWTDGTTDWLTLSNTFGGKDWTLVGCGDFDGDGKDSVVMSYNNGQLIYAAGINESTKALGSANWSGWEIRAIGDFAGDGKDDLVLFHEETGSMVMCANGNIDNYVSIGQLAPKDWFVVGAGDYNGDAKDDLLVRQYSTGMLGYYSGGDQSQWVEMGRGVDMKWTVIA